MIVRSAQLPQRFAAIGRGNPTSPIRTDASNGAIDGDVTAALLAPIFAAGNSPPVPWRASAPLNNVVKALVGDDRFIKGIQADVTAEGALPQGWASYDDLTAFLREGVQVEVVVNQVVQARYAFQQLIDTRAIQRMLDIFIVPDPTFFGSLTFNFIKPNANIPTDILIVYRLNTYWSRRGEKR